MTAVRRATISVIRGGFCGSASLGEGAFGLYEPIHGSAPDFAGKNLANPIGATRSVALLGKLTLGLPDAAARIDAAIDETLARYTKAGRVSPGRPTLGTAEFTDAVLARIG
jgi:3-isopropylmalate dehydrogenase